MDHFNFDHLVPSICINITQKKKKSIPTVVGAASTCKRNVVDRDVRGFVGGSVYTFEEHLERQRVSADRGS